MNNNPSIIAKSGHTAENNDALNELLKIAAQPLPLENLLIQSLDALLALSWLSILPKAGIFINKADNDGEPLLHLIAERNLGEQITSLCAKVRFGHCLCGRAAEQMRPIHAACIDERHDTRFEGIQPHGHYNIPVISSDQLVGVMVFYLPHGKAKDSEELDFLSRAAGIIALMIELQDKQQKLQNVVRELEFQKLALDQHAIVSITDVKGNITYANEKFCDISGYSLEELKGQNHRLLKSGFHSQGFFNDLWQTIAHGQVWHGDIKNRKKQGGFYWVRASIVPFLNAQGKPYQYVAIRTDITEQKNTEEAFARAQKVAEIGNWTFNIASNQLTWSEQIFNIFGLTAEDFTPNFETFFSCIHPEDQQFVQAEYQNSLDTDAPYDIDHRIIHQQSGEIRWVNEKCVHHRDDDGQVTHSDGTVQDITDKKLALDEIRRLAMTDQLTGLANRNQFYRRFDECMKLAKRENKLLAVMLLDLDKFKPVNDTLGHQFGDMILQSVARLFTLNCRDSDVVARLGGDEFAILQVHPASALDSHKCAQRIIADFQKPFDLAGHQVKLGVSIGISIYPDDSNSQDELIRQADLALYEAKHLGRNRFHLYDIELEK